MARKHVVVTGAAGRIGRVLQVLWGKSLAGHPILWCGRRSVQGIDLEWNMGSEPVPDLPSGAVILHLAGQTRGDTTRLAENRRAVAALATAARNSGLGHVFLMSSIAVHGLHPGEIDEDVPPKPLSPYGAAKLEAEAEARASLPPDRLTILRLGNLAGADALLSNARLGPVTLDPIAGQPGGPRRSYIGPRALAHVLEALILATLKDRPLPAILNVAQSPALAMADLLDAYGTPWQFGLPRAEAIGALAFNTARLQGLIPLPIATAQGVIDDLNSLKGVWP